MREEFGSRAYFPDVINTTFDLPHDIGRVSVSLVVEGADPAVPGTRKRKLTLNGDNGFHNPRVKLPPDLCKKYLNATSAAHLQSSRQLFSADVVKGSLDARNAWIDGLGERRG